MIQVSFINPELVAEDLPYGGVRNGLHFFLRLSALPERRAQKIFSRTFSVSFAEEAVVKQKAKGRVSRQHRKENYALSPQPCHDETALELICPNHHLG